MCGKVQMVHNVGGGGGVCSGGVCGVTGLSSFTHIPRLHTIIRHLPQCIGEYINASQIAVNNTCNIVLLLRLAIVIVTHTHIFIVTLLSFIVHTT